MHGCFAVFVLFVVLLNLTRYSGKELQIILVMATEDHSFRSKKLRAMEKDENMKKKEKEENPVAWSNLGDDMKGEVMAQLNPFDRIRFRAVCRNWFLTRENRNHRIEDKLPWLLTFEFKKNCLAFTLYDPIHTNPYLQVDGIVDGIQAMEKSTSKPRWKVTSKHGWVFFLFDREYSTTFFLFCPLTKQIMKLPPLTNGRTTLTNDSTTGCLRTFITFSTPPNSADCVFFVVRDYKENKMDRIVTISTYRPAVGQKSDTWITTEHLYNNNREKTRAVYADPKGVLYFVSDHGRLSTYIDENRGPFLNGGWGLLIRWGHLLESNGDLLLVNVRETRVTHVFKYDWVDKHWVRVNSLRDQALFIDDSFNLFAVKADVGNDQTRNIANKIHYIGSQYSFMLDQPFVYLLYYEIGSSGKPQKSNDTGSGYYSYISNKISRNRNIIWIEPPLYLLSK